jgi:hypothetical protein
LILLNNGPMGSTYRNKFKGCAPAVCLSLNGQFESARLINISKQKTASRTIPRLKIFLVIDCTISCIYSIILSGLSFGARLSVKRLLFNQVTHRKKSVHQISLINFTQDY